MLLTYFLKYLKVLFMRMVLVTALISITACLPFVASGSPNKEKPLVIMVVDTGMAYQGNGTEAKLCKYGHKDYTKTKIYTTYFDTVDKVPWDRDGHGTNVVGLIERALKGRNDYCIVIVKFWESSQNGSQTVYNTLRSIRYAERIGADILNYSAGGKYPNETERKAVIRYLDSGGKMVTAAGNEGQNLDIPGNTYFPAQYDKRIIVVGNIDQNGNRVPSSNYGSVVDRVEIGFNQEGYGVLMTGTSQATAIATGKIAREILNARK